MFYANNLNEKTNFHVIHLPFCLYPFSSYSPETNDDLLLLCYFGLDTGFICLQLLQVEAQIKTHHSLSALF